MFNFDIYTDTTAPADSKALLTQVADNVGFVPNIFAVTAASPNALAGLLAINSAFGASSFSPEQQQVILMATSVENACVYCVAGHTLMSKGLGMPDAIVSGMRNQQPIADPSYDILRRIVSELIQQRGRIAAATLTTFLEQGYSKAQLFELVLGLSVKTFTNYISNALSLPLDDAFKPYQWTRPEAVKATL